MEKDRDTILLTITINTFVMAIILLALTLYIF